MEKIRLITVSAILTSTAFLNACSSDRNAVTERDPIASASYRVTFSTQWTSTGFPTNFPGGAHFSALTGATHNDQVIFWEKGQAASAGIESMAETGAQGTLINEVQAAQSDGKAQFILGGSGAGATGTVSFEFDINPEYPLVTLVSMVAPSPDWFVGVQNFTLYDSIADDWKQTVTANLAVYDAGTDSAATFIAGDSDTKPTAGITLLSSTATDTDFVDGVGPAGEYIASFRFERIK
ncbi:MAG: spondin domain-containing protein [Proteobacteria bacterium]|nr:spondin domain-containing protein [Pseudomonadota bacterium]